MKRVDTQKIGCGAMVKYLLFAIVVLSVLNPVLLPQSIFRKGSNRRLVSSEEQYGSNFLNTGGGTKFSFKLTKDQGQREIVVVEEQWNSKDSESVESKHDEQRPNNSDFEFKSPPSPSFNKLEKPTENKSPTQSGERQISPPLNETHEQSPTISDVASAKQESKLIYDSSNPRYNICTIQGDIRVLGSSSTILFIAPSPTIERNNSISTWKLKPYPRKWEDRTMEGITEITIRQLRPESGESPHCDVTHEEPAVVFSTARFSGNLFHDYTDMLIPLFLASHRYNGKVRFLVTNFTSKPIEKYQAYLTQLSHYPLINIDTETLVHCFPYAQVGLENPGPLGYDASKYPKEYLQDFRQFVRTSLLLERAYVERGRKPRLLILLRKLTRSIVNQNEVIAMAESVGFEVVGVDTETTKDFPRIAHIVNSCDVLMGIHGAGLANMLYLPTNGTVLQILPWGDLKWVGRFDYGDPPIGMGLNYVEYQIQEEETTLIEKYPRDHPVIRDPQSIHKQGWMAVYIHYLHEQNVKLDIDRFKGVLVDLFQSFQQ